MTHADLDHLSALVDGIDDDGTAAHVAACEVCAATLERLRSSSAAVAQPLPAPDEEERDRAVEAALAAVFDAPVVRLPRARRRQIPGWAIGVAAALLVVAVALPLIGRLASGTRTSSSSTASKQTTAGDAGVSTGTASSSGGALQATAGETAAPDFGAVDDDATLRSRLAGLLPAPTVKAPAAAAQGSQSGNTAADSSQAGGAPSPCEAGATSFVAVHSAPVAPPATLVWRGTPARAFVFERSDGSRVAVVVSAAECRLLETLTL